MTLYFTVTCHYCGKPVPIAEKRKDSHIRLPEKEPFRVVHEEREESARTCYAAGSYYYRDLKETELKNVPNFKDHTGFKQIAG